MLEIEAKYPLAEKASFLAQLEAWGARHIEDREDADHYFNSAERDFARTDEALRIRQSGERNFITYKGPKIDAETKTRKEIEVSFAQGDKEASNLKTLLQLLGYRPVAVVRKRRSVYELEREDFLVHFCVDDVQGVGKFMEIEIVATEDQYERAKKLLQRVADELGLASSERRSYLEMLLRRVNPLSP